MASSEAENLRRIREAVDKHNTECPFPPVEIAMNPFEVERLGWTALWGLRIVEDENIGTGRFQIRCERDKTGEGDHIDATEKAPAGVVD